MRNYPDPTGLTVVCESCESGDHGHCEPWCSWCDCDCNLASGRNGPDADDQGKPGMSVEDVCWCGARRLGGVWVDEHFHDDPRLAAAEAEDERRDNEQAPSRNGPTPGTFTR